MTTSEKWAAYYRVIDEMRTAVMCGDFARGQRDRAATPVPIGTFAHGQRQHPPLATQMKAKDPLQ